MYSNKMMEIFKNPTNAGGLQGANGTGKYIDDACGDFVKIYLKINENEEIQEARFKTMGTTATIVASSVICTLANGLTITEAQNLTVNSILEYLGEFPNNKLYTLDFAVNALNLAIENYFDKQEKEAKKQGKEYVRSVAVLNVNETASAEDLDEYEEDGLYDFDDEVEEEQTQESPAMSKEELRARIEAIFSKKDASESSNGENLDDYSDDDFDDFLEDDEIQEEQPKEEAKPQVNAVKKEEVDAPVESEKEEVDLDEIEESNKATKLVEEAKNYTPLFETKIVKDADLQKFGSANDKKDTSKPVSSAKAIFDSMFEE